MLKGPTIGRMISCAVLCCLMVLGAGAAATAQKIHLVMGHYTLHDEYRELAQIFMERNPDIEVEYLAFTSYSDFVNKMPVMIASNTAPDVFAVHHLDLVDWAHAGWLMPLDEFAANDPIIDLEEFFPFSINAFRWQPGSYTVGEGNLYAMPTTYQTAGVPVFNMDIFDNMGLAYPDETWTWDDELAAYRRMMIDADGDGVYEQVGSRIPVNREARFMPRVWQAGGELINADYSKALTDSPVVAKVLQWLYEVGPVHLAASNSAGSFEGGKVGITYSGQWSIPNSKWYEIIPFRYGVFLHPKHPETGSRTIGARPDGMGVSATSAHPEAAWRLLSFITGPEVQEIRATRDYMAVPHIPSAVKLYQMGGEGGLPHFYYVMPQMLIDVHPTYYLGMQAREIGNIVNKWMSDAVNGRITVAEAIANMTQEIDAVLKSIRE